MNITKLGHCCLLVEVGDVRILTDPGNMSDAQNSLKDIDLILITHEHVDHLHTESLKQLMEHNPAAKIISNSSVAEILKELGYRVAILEDSQGERMRQDYFSGVHIEAFGNEHAEIYEDFGRVQNTGYLIAETLYIPGDAFNVPDKSVDILAMPVAGPWCRLKEAIDFAKLVKPRLAFPVHDGMLKIPDAFYRVSEKYLTEAGIHFQVFSPGKSEEFA